MHVAVEIALESCEGSISSCPPHKAYHKGINFEYRQTDGGRQYGPCPMRGVKRDSREYGPCRSRTAAADTDTADYPPAVEIHGFSMSLLGSSSAESDPL